MITVTVTEVVDCVDTLFVFTSNLVDVDIQGRTTRPTVPKRLIDNDTHNNNNGMLLSVLYLQFPVMKYMSTRDPLYFQ